MLCENIRHTRVSYNASKCCDTELEYIVKINAKINMLHFLEL